MAAYRVSQWAEGLMLQASKASRTTSAGPKHGNLSVRKYSRVAAARLSPSSSFLRIRSIASERLREFPVDRKFSTTVVTKNEQPTPPMPELTMEQAVSVAQVTIMQIENPHMQYTKALEQIRQSEHLPLMERWQGMIHVYLSVLLHSIIPFGYPANDEGLKAYNMQQDALMKAASKDDAQLKELEELSRKRWHTLANQAFNVSLDEESSVSLEEARHISSVISIKMQADEFLNSIDEAVAAVGEDPSQEERQRALLEKTLPLQMEVMEEFGYSGENGYVRMQIALMEHASDDHIVYNTMSGALAAFRRAGITVPEGM